MDPYATSHFSHRALLADLKRAVAQERGCCAVVLTRIAEVDERRLFLAEGYPSMYAYCTGELNYTEDAAYKRIYAARAGRRFPLILQAVADGRLHLSGAERVFGAEFMDQKRAAGRGSARSKRPTALCRRE